MGNNVYGTEDIIEELTAMAVESADDQELVGQILRNLEVASRIKRDEERSELEWNKFNHSVKEDALRNSKEGKVTQSQVLSAATNIIGIMSILHYERFAVVGSKALTLVSKIRF